VADNFGLSFDGVFQVFQRMEYSAVILVAGRVILVGVVVLGWHQGAGLLFFAWAYLIVSVLTSLAAMLVCNIRFAPPQRGGMSIKDTIGREGIFFALSSILYMAGTRLDVLALKEWSTPEVLGLYGAAARVMLVFQILPQVLQTSVLPDLFRLGRHDHAGLARFYSSYMRRSLLLSLYPFLWAFCYPGLVVGALFGRDFAAAAAWLRLLSLLLPLRFISLAAGNVLTALDRQWERTIWATLSVGTTVALLVTLVPKRGVAGCIIALLTGEALLAALNAAASRRLGYRLEPGSLLRPLAALVLTGAVLLLIQRVWPLGIVLSLVAVMLIGPAAQLLVGALRPAELRAFLRLRGTG
jgi:O-antigen/teichoic acid export membrane protein